MRDFLWNIFEKSGSIEAFMAYREYKEFDRNNTGEENGDTKTNEKF